MSKHVMTHDEIIDLATGLVELPERRLQATWAYIQNVKYNAGDTGDWDQSRIIFNNIELPLIKRIYPPEMVHEKVRHLIGVLNKRAKELPTKKLKQYQEFRKSGLSLEKSREKIAPIYMDKFSEYMQNKYSRPYKLIYDLSSRDADLLYNLGLDSFLRIFYDRFYQPVNTKQ